MGFVLIYFVFCFGFLHGRNSTMVWRSWSVLPKRNLKKGTIQQPRISQVPLAFLKKWHKVEHVISMSLYKRFYLLFHRNYCFFERSTCTEIKIIPPFLILLETTSFVSYIFLPRNTWRWLQQEFPIGGISTETHEVILHNFKWSALSLDNGKSGQTSSNWKS